MWYATILNQHEIILGTQNIEKYEWAFVQWDDKVFLKEVVWQQQKFGHQGC